jgi:NAD(P)-dependent dehydrogenase (short-subunit alcohol dehydrogenase family)
MSQPAFTKFAKRGALPPTAELNAMFRHSIPEEQGYAVLFLASDEASYVTGGFVD